MINVQIVDPYSVIAEKPQLRLVPAGAVAVPEVAAGYKEPLQISGIVDEQD